MYLELFNSCKRVTYFTILPVRYESDRRNRPTECTRTLLILVPRNTADAYCYLEELQLQPYEQKGNGFALFLYFA